VKIISFAWTTPALLAGRKKVTRREWSKDYAQRFKAGDLVAAYDKNPRNGGKQIATIRLTHDPYLERTDQMPGSDYEDEGLKYFEEQGLLFRGMTPQTFWRNWKAAKTLVWVIRFERCNR
jgi:hypothetical protein